MVKKDRGATLSWVLEGENFGSAPKKGTATVIDKGEFWIRVSQNQRTLKFRSRVRTFFYLDDLHIQKRCSFSSVSEQLMTNLKLNEIQRILEKWGCN